MKAIIIGLGSMGKRRARLLNELDPSFEIVGIDSQEGRRKQAEEELKISTCETIEDACLQIVPDLAFISTPPLSHSEIITECLERDIHVFTELNLVSDGYDRNIELAEKKNKVLFISSTFLYRKEIQYIGKCVDDCGCSLSYTYHVGQYLPDWHPWESYKSFFVGDKRTNGCRELMAIELPWITDVFGKIKTYTSICSKDSSLDIDFPDIYQIMLEHENGHKGMVTIDVVSRKAIRNLEISGEYLYLVWRGTPDSLFKYDYVGKHDENIILYDSVDNRKEYNSFIIENAYKSEIENYLNVIRGTEDALYSFEKDKDIISLIDTIESESK